MKKINNIHFQEIDSTSSYIIREVDNLEDLTIVSCDFQSKGKGREDRVWLANKNENVMFSILIKDKTLVNRYNALSMLSALIVRNYMEAIGVNNGMIKWPNDVYINDKKVCGILLQGQLPNYLVIGIGINVNQYSFIGNYRISPTSLYLESGINYDLEAFREGLFKYLLNELDKFKKGIYEPINEIRKYNYLINKDIKEGRVVDINPDYSLKVASEEGFISISSGEIDL